MQIKFSKIEIRDLAKAWVIISIAFANVLTGTIFGFEFLMNLLLSAITVGTGFLFHELGHKFMAQKYGCFAEFRANNRMLFIAIIISFLGVIFAAPGAVMIAGRISKSKYGKVSLAGPLVNIVFALIFMCFSFFFVGGFAGKIIAFGFIINAWLALFNMIPVWVLDGKKVLSWNKSVYFVTLGICIALVVLGWILPLSSLF
jgi:Zn-dependent protease